MKKFLFVLVTLSLSKGVQKGFSQNNLPNYFQQEVDYTIQVKLDDEKNMLRATESMVYINNSPDTLKFIWFHLWANAYKNNNTAFAKQKLENGATDFYFSTEEERGFIDSLDFKVNDESVKLEYDANNIDIARIWLNKPLAPHEQITITTPFRVKIPKTFSRMGRDGQQYQISQWYPKPAVYDRYGWHPIPYLDQGEFYSEYGVLDVFITLPKNYVMDATGELMSDDEKKFLAVKEASSRKYLSLEMSEAQKEIAENDSFSMKFPVSDYEMKTLHFHAEDVHDFAWFADKRYMIVRDVVTLESGKKVATTVLFTSNHTNVWRNSVQFVDSAIYYYSKWIGDYPYPHATAVDGALTAGGGMEYPMITVIGKTGNAATLDEVIAHEVGHNWFYGILGFNERMHPWMDEGINSYYEARYSDRHTTMRAPWQTFLGLGGMNNLNLKNLEYLITARPQNDQPADIPAYDYTELNYGTIVYGKVPVMMAHLAASMGQENFDSTMHILFSEWKFKHVYPVDMKNVFEKTSNASSDWFFEQYLNTTDKLDYKLIHARDTSHIASSVYYNVRVKNSGEVKAPYSITALKNDEPVLTKIYGGVNGKIDVLFPYGDYDKLVIDFNKQTPEFRRTNNQLKLHGVFRRMEPLRLQPVASLEIPERTQLFFSPVYGYNVYDGNMLGLALYNSFIPARNVQWQLAPMYSFNTKQLTGIGRVQFYFFPKNSFIKNICWTTSAESFHNNQFHIDSLYSFIKKDFVIDSTVYSRFKRFSERIDFTFKNKSQRTNSVSKITLRSIVFYRQIQAIGTCLFCEQYFPGYPFYFDSEYQNYLYNQIKFSFEKQNVINPFSFFISMEQVSRWMETFNYNIHGAILLSTEFTTRINYKKKNDGLGIRFYADYAPMISNVSGFNPHLTATNGSEDYAFDEAFLARSEQTGFLSHQILLNRGGMKFSNSQLIWGIGDGGNFSASLNLTSTLFLPLPIFAFADFGYASAEKISSSIPYNSFQYDGGIGMNIVPGICTAYLTLVASPDIKLNAFNTDEYNKWYKRYFFTINFSKLVPIEKLRDLKI